MMLIDPGDLRVDVYMSGYRTNPLVRITHTLTGVVCEDGSTPSQIINRERALAELTSIIRLF